MSTDKAVRGPIRVSANGRHFVDGAGRPFFWLGDTAWPLFGSYSPQEADLYLANRAALGFTVIQGVLAWGGGTGFETPLPGPNALGDEPWLGSPEHPNQAYFQNVDRIVRRAGELGLVLAMLPTWGYYVKESGVLNTANARAYGRWLGERYRDAENVVWINGGDRVPDGTEEVFRALGHGLRAGDGGAHLITYHPCGWYSSAQFFHEEDWLDFNMIETWTEWPQVYPAVQADALRTPVKPVVLGEGAYENGPEYPLGPITPLVVRRQAWWSFMAGGFFTYGQDRMWRMGPGWTETLNTPGAEQMSLMRKIVESRPWWQLSPDQGVFVAGVSSERTLNAAMRAADGRCVMIYLASQCHVRVHLAKVAARKARATWVNPATCEERDAGTFETGNLMGAWPRPQAAWFSTPDHWEDAVLILDAVEG
ncbi:MAG: apiosidase-like domain-containing protein [Anaerolineae bacterium]